MFLHPGLAKTAGCVKRRASQQHGELNVMSKENFSTDRRNPLKTILIILLCIVGFIGLLLLGARAYFRLPISEYYKNSEKAFVIPGLNDGMVHQGLSYDRETDSFFITGYRTDGKASQVSIVSKSDGKEVKRLNLANEDGSIFKGHVGGISVYGNYVYVADGKGLAVFNKADFVAASFGDSVKSVGTFNTSVKDDYIRVAFTHVEGDTIYVGEFFRNANYPTPDTHKYTTAAGDENTALIVAYKLDGAAPLGISGTVERAYSVTSLVQGMCFDADGKIYLSTSYAVAFSHVYGYDATKREGNITVLGQTVPLYVLDSSTMICDIKLAPMSEEIVIVDGKLFTMCEAATNKYIFGKFTSAKYCYATDLSKYTPNK